MIACGTSTGCRQPAGTATPVARIENAQALEAEAQSRLQQGDFAGAIAPMKQLARVKPDTPDIYRMLGGCVLRAPNRDAILTQARSELTNDQNDIGALIVAINALPGDENEKERCTYLRRLVTLCPNDTEIRKTLAHDLVNAFLYEEALPHLEKILAQGTPDPLPYYLRGKVRFFRPVSGNTDRGESDFKQVLQLQADFALAHLYLGKIYLSRNQPKLAVTELQQANTRMPHHLEVTNELLRAYRATGDTKKVAEFAAEFARLRALEERSMALITKCGAFPNDVDLRIQTVAVLMEKGEYGKAVPFLRRAMRLRPDDPQIKQLADRLQQGLQNHTGKGEP